ncbi:MAG: hypothetical protein HXY36_02490 [Chloroflexi bacterium]|nr:hypothetical protein [Chloroflexota bacterium]
MLYQDNACLKAGSTHGEKIKHRPPKTMNKPQKSGLVKTSFGFAEPLVTRLIPEAKR